MDPIVLIDVDRCVGCYMCQRACALAQCIEVNEATGVAEVVRPEDCTGCMACERACPYGCIIVISDGVDVSARAKVTLSRVRRYATKKLVTADPRISVRQGAKVMVSNNIGSLVLLDNNLIRIVTETDLLTAWYLGREEEPLLNFSHEAVTIEGRATVWEALQVMMERGIGHLPVLERGKLVGMLSIRDALRIASVTTPVAYGGETLVPLNPNEKIKDFARRCPILHAPTTASQVISTLMEGNLKALLVKDGERVGMVSVRDLTRALAVGKSLNDPVEPRYVKPILAEEPISKAIATMMEHNVRHLPVLDQGELKILSIKEIAKHVVWVRTSEIKV